MLPIDAIRNVVLVPVICVGVITIVRGMLVRESQYPDGRAVTFPFFIIDLLIFIDNLSYEVWETSPQELG